MAAVDTPVSTRPQRNTGQRSGQTGPQAPVTTGNTPPAITSQSRSKRPAPDEDVDGDGDEGQGGARRPSKRPGGHLPLNKSLACPFWKLDPGTHRECLKREKFLGVNRVKQHLTRSHAEGAFSCQRCKAKFEDEEEQERHLQDVNAVCVYRLRDPRDRRITRKQQAALSKKSKPGTHSEQWFAVWRILFPDCQEPQSAYIDSHVSEDLRLFREYASQQGPVLLLQELLAQGFREPEVSHSQGTLEAVSRAAAGRALESVIEVLVSCLTSSRPPLTPVVDSRGSSRLEATSSNEQDGLTRQDNSSFLAPLHSEPQPEPFPGGTRLPCSLRVGSHNIPATSQTLP